MFGLSIGRVQCHSWQDTIDAISVHSQHLHVTLCMSVEYRLLVHALSDP